MPSLQLSKIRAAAVDGRLVNPLYRQTQLKNLHDALSASTAKLEAALGSDSPDSRPVDIRLEVRLALRLLAETATGVAPEQALKDEYAVARGQDLLQGRQPYGVVVIEEPVPHAFLYGLVSALAPAIAEGNVVVVQTKGNSLLQAPPLVFALVAAALEKDIFTVVQDELRTEDVGHRHLRVVQNGNPSSSSAKIHTLVSDPSARTVAIVERDADIQAAADALVAARFSLGGRSPHAPDLVLVNEWVKRDLIIALSASSARFMADAVAPGAGVNRSATAADKRSKRSSANGESGLAAKAVDEGSAMIISSNPTATIVDVSSRDSPLLGTKVGEPCLLLHSVTSMDDAIDTAPRHGTLAAAYVFTKPEAAKYIGQFVDAGIIFVNQLPPQILFGPAAPAGHALDLASNKVYAQSLFSLPKPQLVVSSALTRQVAAIMANPHSTAVVLDPKALPAVKRLKKRLAMGFFEQGIATGGLLLLSAVLSCTGYFGWVVVRTVRARLL